MKQQVADRMRGISAFYVMELLQRAKQLEREGRDVIHMEIGEPDFPTPQAVIDAGRALLKTGEVKYTAAAGLPELREAIAEHYVRQYGVKVDPGRVFITPGASGAFLLAFGISLNPGEQVMMADPCYPCNDNFVRLFNGQTHFVNVGADTEYQLTADLIAQNWRPNSKGVLAASPSNPTGTLLNGADLKYAIDQVHRLGGCFYSDEIYHGLIYDQPAATALAHGDDAFVINSFSKFFGMTGWRVGWLVVPDDFVEAAEKLAQNIFISTPTHSQHAALASFTEDNLAELERRRLEFKARRDFLYTNLLKLGFKIACKPEGAFYIYADCSAFTDNSFAFAGELLEREGVAVTPGRDFGKYRADKHIRFAYTASIDRMAEALTRLERFICR
ncbi:pyridoxal phosphate-dependent aminotransferase [Methylomonas sp. SURF-2]|uniref:Aminotransferase n=1 Tax=Methylomonas subterranea TaxID=2952225 RepID=A0ABT1TEV0_9GAMM|nr:pyridoxal phosphate-dependent aminotransferase [Methylomonas sp. SURF-2]MCQ8103994.1 pyridoxal phosphate-dependent aminotransferase [Methylomonas sp. SURF-2]